MELSCCGGVRTGVGTEKRIKIVGELKASTRSSKTMANGNLLITGSAIVLGLLWLGAWIVGKIRRGEIEIGVHTALLALIAAILLVPFAMNVTAHLIANSMNHPTGEEHAGQPEDLSSAHRHNPL